MFESRLKWHSCLALLIGCLRRSGPPESRHHGISGVALSIQLCCMDTTMCLDVIVKKAFQKDGLGVSCLCVWGGEGGYFTGLRFPYS